MAAATGLFRLAEPQVTIGDEYRGRLRFLGSSTVEQREIVRRATLEAARKV
jgi:hypothetical protein